MVGAAGDSGGGRLAGRPGVAVRQAPASGAELNGLHGGDPDWQRTAAVARDHREEYGGVVFHRVRWLDRTRGPDGPIVVGGGVVAGTARAALGAAAAAAGGVRG